MGNHRRQILFPRWLWCRPRAWLLVIAFCLTTSSLSAATVTWNGGGADNNWTTVANWVGGVAPVAGDALVFAGTTRLTPSNDFTAGTSFASITFNSGAGDFTIGGNALTLTGGATVITNSATTGTMTLALPLTFATAAPTITSTAGSVLNTSAAGTINNGTLLLTVTNTGVPMTFTGVISNTGGLTKSGAGVLILAGANTYTGATTVNAGSLRVTGSTVASSAVTVNSGGTVSGTGTVAGTVAVANGGTLSPGAAPLVASFVNTSLRAVTQDDWRSTQTITGTRVDQTINQPGNAFGTAAERAAYLIGGNDGDWDNFSVQWDGHITVATANTTLSTRSDDYSRVWIDLNDNGVVDNGEWGNNGWLNGSGGQGETTTTVHASLAAGTYRMRVQYEEGWGGNAMYLLWSDAVNSAGTVAGLYVVPANLLTRAIGTLTTGAVTFNGTSTFQVDLNGTTPTFDQLSTAGAVACAGTLTIGSVVNPAVGKVYTIINAGSVSGTFFGLVNNAMFVQQGRTFQIAYSASTVTLTEVVHPTTRIWVGGGADSNWSTGANWDQNVIPIAGDDVQFAGSTRLTPNNDLTAGTSFASITFNAGAGAFVIGGNSITLAGNVTNNDDSLQTITLAMSMAATRTFAAASGDLAIGGILSGAGDLTKTGAGTTLTLTGMNTYTGVTTISAGTLSIGNGTTDGSIATSLGIVDNAALVYNLVGSRTYGNVISGTGTLSKSGAGTLTLSGANTYTGTTTISAGTVLVSGSLAAGSAVTVNSGGTLGGSGTVAGSITVANGGTLAPGGGQLVASFVASGLRAVIENDWRVTRTITGTRVDQTISQSGSFGTATERAAYGIGGSDTDWNNFSVQWDGHITVATANTTISTRSDDGSRVWLDLNNNGVIDDGEWGSNGWGSGQGETTRTVHASLAAGTYRMRVQYEEGDGGNAMYLLWSDAVNSAGTVDGLYVVPANLLTPIIGTLTTGAVTFNSTSTYAVDLNGTTPTFDRVTSSGIVTCAGTLTVASIANSAVGKVYTIASGTSVTGTFSGLAEGALLGAQSRALQISYLGNAVTLTDVVRPTTRVWDGGSLVDNNWTTAANWDFNIAPIAGDDLQFAGTTRLAPNNDFPANTSFASITFNSGAGAFVIGPTAIASGTISREVWTGVGGTAVADIPTGTTPNISDTLSSLEGPTDWADNYGTRVRGFVIAPTTGNYTFWIASDDNSELWLSTDTQLANKVLIASVASWTNSREWNKYASQKSSPIALTAGQKYYIEALQKEGGVGDHLAVGWAKPGESTTSPSEVIPGAQLSPYGNGYEIVLAGSLTNNSSNVQTINLGLNLAATRTVNCASGNVAVGGIISGAGGLTKTGASVLTLTGTNTFTGTTTISAGTLSIGNGTTDGSIATSAGIINNAALSYNLVGARTYGNVISGTGTLTKSGAGTLTLTGTNTYTGVTTISVGTLSIGDGTTDGSIATSAGITNNAALIYNLVGARTYGNVISGTGTLTKSGAGTLTLTGTNTYTGVTTISAGTLTAAGGSAIPNASAVVLANVAGARLHLANSETIGSLAGGGSTGGNVTSDAACTVTVGADNTSTAYAGIISVTSGLTKIGSGTLTLGGTNTYAGATTVSQGTLKLDKIFRYYRFQVNATQGGGIVQLSELGFYSAGSFTSVGGAAPSGTRVFPIAVFDGGTWNGGEGPTNLYDANTATKWCDIAAGMPQRVDFDFGAPLSLIGYDWATANDTTPGRNPDNWQVFGSMDNITWSAALDTQTGAGGVPGSTFTWAAGWALTSTAGSGALPSATAVAIADNATLDLNSVATTIGSLTGTALSHVTLGSGTVTTGGDNTTTTFAGDISGSGGLTKAGTGTLTLTGTNTYTGVTTISAGTLRGTGTLAGALSVAGGTVAPGTSGAQGTFTGGTTAAFNAGGTLSTRIAGYVAGTSFDRLAQSGALTLGGTSALTLDLTGLGATGTATGIITCSGTPVAFGSVTISNNTNNYNVTLQYASGSVNVVISNGGATLYWHPQGASTNGNLATNYTTDQAGLVRAASINATDALSFGGTGTNSDNNGTLTSGLTVGSVDCTGYTGTLTDAGFTVSVGGNVTLVSGMTFTTTGTLTLSASATLITGTKSLNNLTANTGTLTMGDALTVTGVATLGAAVTNGGFLLTVNSSGVSTIGGLLSGTGGLTKSGSGSLTLSGANTFSGGTTLSAGTLNVNSTAALGATGGTFTVTGGTLDNTSGGALTLANNNAQSWNGDFTFTGTNALNLGTGAVAMNASRQVTVSASTLTVGGVISGTGFALTKAGAGTLTFTGTLANTYSGVTTINAGNLVLQKTAGVNAIAGDIAIGNASGSDVLRLGASDQIANTSVITFTSGGDGNSAKFELNGYNETVAGITSNANQASVIQDTENGGPAGPNTPSILTVSNTADVVYDGLIRNNNSGSGSIGLTKAGTGMLTLRCGFSSGAVTYTGATTINGGTLVLDGLSAFASATTVNNGGTLAGNATTTAAISLASGGTVAPGLTTGAIGTLTTAAVTYVSGSTYSVDLNGTGPTADRITSSGTVALASATLTVASNANPLAGTVYTIVSGSSITGTFNGLTNNAVFAQAGRLFRIVYTATTVTLTDMAPTLTSRQTLDTNGNGRIDRIRLTFDRSLNDTFTGFVVAVTGYTVTGYVTGATGNDAIIEVLLTESGTPDTGATPLVQITANTGLADASGSGVIQVEGTATAATDTAKPVLLSSLWSDLDGNGVDPGDTLVLTFSENVTSTSMVVADLGLPVTSDSLATSTIADKNTATATITVVFAGTPLVTPGGTYASGAVAAGKPSGIYLAVATHLSDQATVANSGLVGNAASAVDVGSALNAISIEWTATGNATARTWVLNTLSLGEVRNTVTDALDLGIINRGDITVDVQAKVAASTPSGWTAAGAAGQNVFLAKAHNGTPADGTNPALFSLTLSTVDQDLKNILYPGLSTGLHLYFRAPTSLTVGGGTQQTITITLTARAPP